MRGRDEAGFLSLGAILIVLLTLAAGRLRSVVAPPGPVAACDGTLPFTLALPPTLPPAPSAAPSATPVVGNTPAATAIPATDATPAPTGATLASLLRADDPPGAHGLRLVDAGPLPLLPDPPCALPPEQRRASDPCVALLPPGGRLCADGVVADGTLDADPNAPVLALEAVRVTVTDAGGATLLDTLQGYLRYDDPAQGLRLFCPQVRLLQQVGPSARSFVALCSNDGVEGWAVSGQATDGATAAPDSVGLTIDAPDGSQRALAGPLATGAVLVRAPRADAGP